MTVPPLSSGETHEARRIINSIRVFVENRQEPVIAFVSVTRVTDEGVSHGYLATQVALRGDTRQGVLSQALAGLRGWRERYSELEELAPVFDAIEQVEAEVLEVQAA